MDGSRLLGAGVIMSLLLLLSLAFSPPARAESGWRVRVQQRALTHRLVALGYSRGDAERTIAALSAAELERLSRNIGLTRPASTLASVLGLLVFVLFGLLVLRVWR